MPVVKTVRLSLNWTLVFFRCPGGFAGAAYCRRGSLLVFDSRLLSRKVRLRFEDAVTAHIKFLIADLNVKEVDVIKDNSEVNDKEGVIKIREGKC